MNRAGLDFENGRPSKRGVIKDGINQGPTNTNLRTSEEANQRQKLAAALVWGVGVTWKGLL